MPTIEQTAKLKLKLKLKKITESLNNIGFKRDFIEAFNPEECQYLIQKIDPKSLQDPKEVAKFVALSSPEIAGMILKSENWIKAALADQSDFILSDPNLMTIVHWYANPESVETKTLNNSNMALSLQNIMNFYFPEIFKAILLDSRTKKIVFNNRTSIKVIESLKDKLPENLSNLKREIRLQLIGNHSNTTANNLYSSTKLEESPTRLEESPREIKRSEKHNQDEENSAPKKPAQSQSAPLNKTNIPIRSPQKNFERKHLFSSMVEKTGFNSVENRGNTSKKEKNNYSTNMIWGSSSSSDKSSKNELTFEQDDSFKNKINQPTCITCIKGQ